MSLSRRQDLPPTPAQQRVLKLISEGYADHELAVILSISPHTARTHSNSLLHRLGARSRAHAVAIAYDSGWLP